MTMPQPRFKKNLGQHHLTRAEICGPLIDFLAPGGKTVIEIGPGGGVLTGLLDETGAHVLAVELDRPWAFALCSKMPAVRRRLVIGDALEIAWERVPVGTVLAGNLPYQIAATLIAGLLPLHERIERMGFLVQLEVAQRLTANPGGKEYGALSVHTQAFADARILGRVAPGSFRPPPKVESAFVGLSLRPPPLPADQMPEFTSMVRLAFGQRRKTLRNALSAGWGRERADAVLVSAAIDPRARAEQLGLEDFLRLYRVHRGRPRSQARS